VALKQALHVLQEQTAVIRLLILYLQLVVDTVLLKTVTLMLALQLVRVVLVVEHQ
jgi:hypothetical protein